MTQKQLVLNSSGYVLAITGDIGKVVTDDGTAIGILFDFNNTTRTWIIETLSTIATSSVMAITGGTGAGTAYSTSTSIAIYSTKNMIKERLPMDLTNTTFDTSLDNAGAEASRFVDSLLRPYITVPLTTPDEEVQAFTSDFATSLFKRRMMPSGMKITNQLTPEGLNQIEAQGWFAQGIKRVQEYIKSKFTLAQTIGNSAYNPAIFTDLYKNGIITAKEARAFINASTTVYLTEIDTKTSSLVSDITENVEKTLEDTQTKILTDTEDVTKTLEQTDTVTKTTTLHDVITTCDKGYSEHENIKTDTDVLTDTKTLVKDETNTLSQTDEIQKTIGEDVTKTLGETDTVTKVLTDTILKDETLTKSQRDDISETKELELTSTEDINKTENLEKTQTDILTEEISKTKEETETKVVVDTRTLTEDALITRNRKNKAFVFIESDENGGYQEQGT